MDNTGKVPEKPHRVVLQARKRMEITGVKDVDSFDEHEVLLETQLGGMRITGDALHVGRLLLEAGEVDIEGHIDGVVYTDNAAGKKEGSFLARLLR